MTGIFTCCVLNIKAQDKVPDMKRFVPNGVFSNSVNTQPAARSFATPHSGARDLSRFTQAPLKQGGGAARTAQKAGRVAAVRNEKLASELPPAKLTATIPELSNAGKEQMNITPRSQEQIKPAAPEKEKLKPAAPARVKSIAPGSKE